MKNCYVLLVFFLILNSCKSIKEIAKPNENYLQTLFLQSDFRFSKGDLIIEKNVLRAFEKNFDVLIRNDSLRLPLLNKKTEYYFLKMNGYSKDSSDFGFILYEYNGIGIKKELIVFRNVDRKTIEYFKVEVSSIPNEIDELKKVIRNEIR